MNRELPRQRRLLSEAEHLLMRHMVNVRGALETLSLLLLLGLAIWLVFPRSWDDVAGRSAIQFGLLTLVTLLSAVALVRVALSLPLSIAPLVRLAHWLSPRTVLTAFVVSMTLGELLVLSPWNWPKLGLPLVYALTTVLPALLVISYVSKRLRVRLDLARSLGLLSYGTLVAIALAQVGETGANALLSGISERVISVWSGSGGHLSVDMLRSHGGLGDGDTGLWVAGLVVILLTLTQAVIVAPVIEEAAKVSGLLFPRLRLDRNGAFVGGLYAGLGFALAESLLRGSSVAGDGTLLFLRGGAGVVHALATGLGALAVYDLLHGQRRSAFTHAVQAFGVHAVWNLVASTPSLLGIVMLVVSPSSNGDATSAMASLPGFQLIWLGTMALLALYLVVRAISVGGALRRDSLWLPSQLPLSLSIDAVRRLASRKRQTMVVVTALVLALIAAGAIDFSTSADAYHQSLVAERYANARENLTDGNYEQALRNLELARRWSSDPTQVDQAIEITRNRLMILTQMYDTGKQYYNEGRWDLAVRYFDRVLALEPRFKDTQQLRQKAIEQAQN
ncbi:MAG: PrsW family intramembrane metalloprotease [Chloroflexota bacterium]|nr:MAG: PrsW family intramembrane metalloprotease [Chloroflexota bacterium]